MQNWIVDAHLDLGWNALQWQRDLTASVMTLRTQEVGMSGKGRAQNTVALPEMRSWYRAVLTDRVIVWAIEAFYGIDDATRDRAHATDESR